MYVSALRRVSIALAFVAAAVLVLALASSDSTNASHTPERTFDPTYDVVLCNGLPSTFSGPAPLPGPNPGGGCSPDDRSAVLGSNPDSTTNLIWSRGNLNYAQDALVTTTAPEFDIRPGSDVAEGTVMGGLISITTLGLAANPCNNIITPNFIFWNASTDGVGDVVVANPEGTPDRWGSPVPVGSIMTDGGDAFAGQADASSLIVTKYPDPLLRQFDPDGNGLFDSAIGGYDPVLPHARYAGGTQVPPGGDWQALQVLIFKPGQLKQAFAANPNNSTHPFLRLDASLGWTNHTVLNDPAATAASVSAISDFCTELSPPLMVLGDPPGPGVRLVAPSAAPGGYDATLQEDGDDVPTAGPPAECGDTTDNDADTLIDADDPDCGRTGADDEGTYLNRVYVLSIRDTDGDGIENSFDTCPFTPNIDDPYDNGGGASPGAGGDLDMLDPACDPTPNNATQYNPALAEDGFLPGTCGDTLDNGGDTVADINDPDCHSPSVAADIDNDTYSNSQDQCPLVAQFPSTDSENSAIINAYNAVAADGGPRTDGIGDPCDPAPLDATPNTDGEQNFLYYSKAVAACIRDDHAAADADNNGFCDAGGLSSATADGDSDAYKDPPELYMATDPLSECSITAKHQAWPPDFDNNKKINILDIVKLTPPTFGAVKGVDPEYRNRLDLNADTKINILDIVKLTPPSFGTSCKTWNPAANEDGKVACNDTVDNDGDTLVDLADSKCTDAADTTEGVATCNDRIDNQPDGPMDAADPDCQV
jgi:hypothetical protein